MFKDSDNIYKNIGVAVSITFLIYILIRVIQIQFDVGSRISTYGSRVIKEGFTEGLTNKKSKSKPKSNESGYTKTHKNWDDIIKQLEDDTLANYIDSMMGEEDSKSDKIDNKSVEIIINMLNAKSNELVSESIKTFVQGGGDIDISTSSDLNNTMTIIDTMITKLGKLK